LTGALAALLLLQAVLGLVFAAQYRDAEWIRAAWYGNDWVTLTVALPLLLAGRARAERGSRRGLLLWLGVTGYAAYNYAFYLFGAALNASFPLYVMSFVFAGVTLILALPVVDAGDIWSRFNPGFRPGVLGGYFLLTGVGLGAVWLGTWAAYVFLERPTPVEPAAFRLVAALDLSIMVPLLVCGGTLMVRGRPWSAVVCAIGGLQASLYLLVLSVSSLVAIQRGLAAAPGELPLWGTLFTVTAAATAVLLRGVREEPLGQSDSQT
jgi:hypothetical protein